MSVLFFPEVGLGIKGQGFLNFCKQKSEQINLAVGGGLVPGNQMQDQYYLWHIWLAFLALA